MGKCAYPYVPAFSLVGKTLASCGKRSKTLAQRQMCRAQAAPRLLALVPPLLRPQRAKSCCATTCHRKTKTKHMLRKGVVQFIVHYVIVPYVPTRTCTWDTLACTESHIHAGRNVCTENSLCPSVDPSPESMRMHMRKRKVRSKTAIRYTRYDIRDTTYAIRYIVTYRGKRNVRSRRGGYRRCFPIPITQETRLTRWFKRRPFVVSQACCRKHSSQQGLGTKLRPSWVAFQKDVHTRCDIPHPLARVVHDLTRIQQHHNLHAKVVLYLDAQLLPGTRRNWRLPPTPPLLFPNHFQGAHANCL